LEMLFALTCEMPRRDLFGDHTPNTCMCTREHVPNQGTKPAL
jgi:hypothetical protein